MGSTLIILVIVSTWWNCINMFVEVVLNTKGPLPAVFTPMNHDQTVNFDVIPRYAHFLHSHGMKHILVGGLPGEMMNLSLQNTKDVIKAWVDVCKLLGIGIIVQVGARSPVEVIEIAKYSASLGVEALLTLPGLVSRPTNVKGLVDYVKLIADAVPNVPVLYDHVPAIAGFAGLMPEFVVAATCNISNFGGIRFRDRNLTEAYRTWTYLKKGQELIYGGSSVLLASTALGMTSSSGTLYNIFPKLVQQIISSYTTGDLKTAMDINLQLAQAVRAITSRGRWFANMKATMEMVTGLPLGPPALPIKQTSDEILEYIREELIGIGLLECDKY